MLQNSISFVTIGVNYFLKEIIIVMTAWVGYETNSEFLTSVIKGVFLAQFFNTGFQLLIVNANLREYGDNIFARQFNGPFTDYNPEWYNNVGDLTLQSMIINSIMPYCNLCSTFMLETMMKIFDSGCSSSPHNTRQTSKMAFK